MKCIILIVICSSALLFTQINANHHHHATRSFNMEPMETPWLVYIQPYDSEETCGGVLISSSWVLTAQSPCTKDSTEFLITIGTSTIHEKRPTMGSTLITANSTILNKKHSMIYLYEYNILLIKLLNEISENDFVKYIRLPKQSTEYSLNSTAISSTWDIIEDEPSFAKIINAEMTFVEPSNCKSITNTQWNLDGSGLCGQGNLPETNKHIHFGGSLVADEDDGIPSLVGILHFHHNTDLTSNYSNIAFIKISKFVDWIHEKTGISIRS